MYCGIRLEIPTKARLDTAKCADCHKIWHKLRNRQKDYGPTTTLNELVLWYISQPQECADCGSLERITIDRITPAMQGGKYEIGNLQLLCYTCNCCKKIGTNSVKKGVTSDTERECLTCHQTFPLTSQYFHYSGRKSKYRHEGKAMFYPHCRICRLAKIREKKVPISQRKRTTRVTKM